MIQKKDLSEKQFKKCLLLDSSCNQKDKEGYCKLDYCGYQRINQIFNNTKNEPSLIEFITEIEKQFNRQLSNLEIFSLLSTNETEKLLTEDNGNFLIDDKGLIFNLRTHKRIR